VVLVGSSPLCGRFVVLTVDFLVIKIFIRTDSDMCYRDLFSTPRKVLGSEERL